MFCASCSARLPDSESARGRPRRFCSPKCRTRAWRERDGLPWELAKLDRWCRRVGKRPYTIDGRPASSADPGTWSSYAAASRSKFGHGVGVMLGDGLGCWDIDHCLQGGRLAPWARQALSLVGDPVFVERSLSGDGLHVFVRADPAPGWRQGGVEFSSSGHFIAVTGHAVSLDELARGAA
ncbi:hypothetical protein [Segniliparus rotundus]|uniref:hypothetical protein n=1 Tax=Segniliparus rotundus TaxID=286802 RepID=UPI000300E2C8|nr:hypothetical protein [Segniliparus rotundus]